jgi:hypothetical protein
MPPVDHDRLPVALIERFTGDGAEPLESTPGSWALCR